MPKKRGNKFFPRNIKANGGLEINFSSVAMQDMDKVVRLAGRVSYSTVGTATNTPEREVGIRPSTLGSRALEVADTFAEWRCTKLQARAWQSSLLLADRGQVALLGIAYQPISLEGATPLKVDLEQYPTFNYGLQPYNEPPLINVPTDELLSVQPKWFQTRVSAGTPVELENQGTLFQFIVPVPGATDMTMRLLIEFELEFRLPVPSSVTQEFHRCLAAGVPAVQLRPPFVRRGLGLLRFDGKVNAPPIEEGGSRHKDAQPEASPAGYILVRAPK